MTAAESLENLFSRARQSLKSGRLAEALVLYRSILRLQPSTEAYRNSAWALAQLGRVEEAVAVSSYLLERAPGDAVAWVNQAFYLAKLDRLEESLAASERALELNPQLFGARTNKALNLLGLGRYRTGFALFEQRWEDPRWSPLRRQFASPLWSGEEPLQGKRILFHSERGYGGVLQLVRYAKVAADAGAVVMLEVQPALKTLLSEPAHSASVNAVGENLPQFDLHCAFSSLPHLFGTTLQSVPNEIPYVHPPRSFLEKWAGIADGDRPAIGFAFRGNRRHTGINVDDRTVPLPILLRLIEGTPHRWICLQLDLSEEERTRIGNTANVVDLGGRIAEWADTAAIVAQLDLVISIDSALAHLAGAMGQPLWVLCPFSPSWQWRAFDGRPAWYPHARVWKQPRPDDWQGAIDEIRDPLMHF